MRPTTIIAAVVLAAALQPLLAQQQSGAGFGGTAAAAPGRAAGASTAQIIATVEAVDAPQRSVTLKGPKGNVQTMTVSEDVRNLAQVKVGDRVIVNYAQALALELRKGASGIRERIERAGVARAAMIGRPIGSVGRQVDVLADRSRP
jgi:hypothetical protein